MRFVYSPYKHVPIALDPVTHEITTAVRGVPTPLVVDGRSTLPRGVSALTLAFATGECGHESWDGMDPQAWVDANLGAFDRAGIDYIISTGGEAGVFAAGFVACCGVSLPWMCSALPRATPLCRASPSCRSPS